MSIRGTQIGAIVRRDGVLLLSYKFSLVLRLMQSAFAVLTLYFLSKLVESPAALAPYGGNYLGFAVIGMVLVLISSLGLGTFTTKLSTEQQTGSLETLLVSPVGLPTLLLGMCLIPVLMTLVDAAVLLGGAEALGADLVLSGLWFAVPVLALTLLTFGAIGLLSAGFIVLTKRGDPSRSSPGRSRACWPGRCSRWPSCPGRCRRWPSFCRPTTGSRGCGRRCWPVPASTRSRGRCSC